MSQQPVHENTIGPGLVNETLLFRKQLRRLYRGTVCEFLRELFQNSDRAGARTVTLTVTAPGRFTYHDDGTGLVNGLRGLFDLLCIANSTWEDESVEPNQLPMGVGFYALIVNPKVRYVRIQSNSVALDIDTARFLDDPAYRNSWVERVEKRPASENHGFSLLVEGEEALTEAVRQELRGEALTPKDYWVSEKRFGPARGYAGRLEIALDGQPVETDLPDWFTLRRAEIVDTYQGNQIRIRLSESDVRAALPPEFARNLWSSYVSSDEDRGALRVLWYGQPITDRQGATCLRIFLDVREGAPVNPQAPTRAALLQDKALADLYAWVKDRVFRFVCLETPSPRVEHVDLLYRLDRGRAERECPWALVRPRRGLPPQPNSSIEQAIESYYDLEELTVGHDRVVRKADLGRLLVLAEEVVVLLPGTHSAFKDASGELPPDATPDPRPFTFAHGLPSFLAALGIEAYMPKLGADASAVLWWRPGQPANEWYTTDLGSWGIGTQDEPPDEWKPVPVGSTLYVHDDIESWSIDYVLFFVGTASQDAFVSWLQHYARVLWYLDEDGDNSEESFDESVDDLIRSLLGNTVAAHVVRGLVNALTPFFGAGEPPARISTVELRYEEGKGLAGLRVQLESGESRELGLY